MDGRIQILYMQLTQEDRDKVDVKIRELFVKQQEQYAVVDHSNTHRQEDCC